MLEVLEPETSAGFIQKHSVLAYNPIAVCIERGVCTPPNGAAPFGLNPFDELVSVAVLDRGHLWTSIGTEKLLHPTIFFSL